MTRSLKIDYQNHAQIPKHNIIAKPAESRHNRKPACTVYYVNCVFLTSTKPILFILCIVVVEMSAANKTQLYIIYIMRSSSFHESTSQCNFILPILLLFVKAFFKTQCLSKRHKKSQYTSN